jgi:hypothetical protein
MMKRHKMFIILLLVIFTIPCIGGGGSDSPKAGYTATTVNLYDSPARLVTGYGWQYGRVIYRLPPNTRVFLYERRTIGFGPHSQSWCYVSFWYNGWKYGWMRYDMFRMLSFNYEPRRSILDVFIGSAYAFENLTTRMADQPTDLKPPDTPPPADDMTTSADPLYWLYGISFGAMILGMFGHEIVKALEVNSKWTFVEFLRRFIPPLFVSPMVFLGFLEFAEFGLTNNRTFIVIPLMAFQNGFFWHSVTMKATPKKETS